MAERGRSQGAVPAARPHPAPRGCDGHLELPAPRAGSAGPLHPNCSPAQKRPLWERGEGQHHTPCQTISWGARVSHPVIQTACGGGRFPRMPLSRVGTRRKTRTPGRGEARAGQEHATRRPPPHAHTPPARHALPRQPEEDAIGTWPSGLRRGQSAAAARSQHPACRPGRTHQPRGGRSQSPPRSSAQLPRPQPGKKCHPPRSGRESARGRGGCDVGGGRCAPRQCAPGLRLTCPPSRSPRSHEGGGLQPSNTAPQLPEVLRGLDKRRESVLAWSSLSTVHRTSLSFPNRGADRDGAGAAGD